MMEVLNDAERSAMGAADAVKQLLDALRGHLKEVTSNTVAHVEMERDTATRLQGAAMEAANRGMRFINACMRCAWGEHGVNVHEVRPTPGTPYPSGAGQHVGNPEGYTATDIVARGAGLHVGHPEGYTATDIVARYKRMRGFNVLHPMGWDAFGLPAEQYAIETGTHPRVTTERNIGRFRSQLKALGFSYDWQREVSTTDPDYYRWTQWIFLQILNRGLAYQADVAVNWCPALGTVLANEEVVDGLSERGGHPVIRKPMRQWMLRITEYADRLLDDLDGLDWPESVKEMQRNWIGRSEGAEVEFAIADVADGSASVRVFTTRPDTICGATYLVLAPEHPLVTSITSEQQRAAVEAYVVAAGQKSDLERTDLAKGKTGVPTGAEAVNPVTGERIPVWVADYVLARRTGLAKSKTGHAMGPEAVNPVTGERIPVWVADYVLASYGTGAIICQRPRMMHVTSHALLLRRLKRHMMHVTSHALTHPSSPLSRCLSYCDLASPCYTAATARGASWQCRDTTRETSNHFPFALPPSPSLPAATARGPSWQCRDSTRETSNHFPFALPPSPSLPAATARGASWQCGDTTPEARLKAPSFTLLFALPHPSHPICCSYGTGAIMAVPAHDSRDLEFAQTFSLPVRQVVRQAAQRSGGGKGKKASGEAAREEEEAAIEEAYAGSGVMVNSGYESTGVDLNGLDNTAAGDAVVAWLEERGLGKKQINYKLRDWLFARQRYWGEPFPVVLVPGEDGQERVVGVPESQLPVVLPEMDDFNPTGTGEPPLAKATDWVNTTDPASGLPARRETNTMPQWAGSCWYYLRFMDPANSNALVDPQKEKYWGPVDLYVGGAEHSVLHLLYARFWHKVLYDIGAVSTKEPFQCLVNQGMILGEVEFTAYRDTASGALLSADAAAKRPAGECVPERVPEEAVEKKGEGYVLRADPSVGVSARAHKMSKSRGNVVNPDHVVFEFGADSLRLYEMFMGPLRETKVWSTKGVEGVHRFLARVWRLLVGQADPATGQYRSHGVAPSVVDDAPSEEQLRALHACIHKVTEEVEAMRFNTAIAAMMEFTNAAYKWPSVPKDAARPLVLLLSPFAPHVAEELWQRLGGTSSLAYEPWPQALPQYLVEDTIALPVQVNGKVRATLQVAVGVEQEAAVAAALDHPNVARLVEGKSVRKTIFVKGRILNLVVG
ncbi:unnamed protein product [Closterium sp. NIES-65]|nr:unnamed protein product [Closterium sp. NIES-65]